MGNCGHSDDPCCTFKTQPVALLFQLHLSINDRAKAKKQNTGIIRMANPHWVLAHNPGKFELLSDHCSAMHRAQ